MSTDRFERLVRRIAEWTEAEIAHVSARQTRHVAQVVLDGADPVYPSFAPAAPQCARVRLQAAWDRVPSLPPIDFTDAEASLISVTAQDPTTDAIAEAARSMIAAWEASVDTLDEIAHNVALEREAAAIYALDLALAGSEDGWYPIATWEGLPTGQANPVLLCVSDGGTHEPIVGEAWYDPEAYGGSWWWANLDSGDYHASPIIEMQHGVPTFWKPMPTPPRAAWKIISVDQGGGAA